MDNRAALVTFGEGKDNLARDIVAMYVLEHIDKTAKIEPFSVFIVWKVKALQNWKYLISTTISDGMYYEVTYNGDKEEWYLDAYKKFENRCIKNSETRHESNA